LLTAQQSFGSGFDASSTSSDVIADIDLSATVPILTGGYSGLGRETARTLTAVGVETSFRPATLSADRRR
jgi:hypothetical protein